MLLCWNKVKSGHPGRQLVLVSAGSMYVSVYLCQWLARVACCILPAHDSRCALQVVQIFQGEIVPSGAAEHTVLPSHLWLYTDGTFGVIFDTWDHNE